MSTAERDPIDAVVPTLLDGMSPQEKRNWVASFNAPSTPAQAIAYLYFAAEQYAAKNGDGDGTAPALRAAGRLLHEQKAQIEQLRTGVHILSAWSETDGKSLPAPKVLPEVTRMCRVILHGPPKWGVR